MKIIKPSSRDAIIEAAFQILNKQPGASLAQIANHAGVGRATLHRKFKSRDVLMDALARTAMEELRAAIDLAVVDATSHTEGLRRTLAAIIPLAERQWFLAHENLEKYPDIAEAYRSDHEELRLEIDAAKSEGTFDEAVPTLWIAQAYENLIFTAWTTVRDGEATAKQATELAWRTLTQGLAAKT